MPVGEMATRKCVAAFECYPRSLLRALLQQLTACVLCGGANSSAVAAPCRARGEGHVSVQVTGTVHSNMVGQMANSRERMSSLYSVTLTFSALSSLEHNRHTSGATQ